MEKEINILEKEDLMFGATTNPDLQKNPIDLSNIKIEES
jgi:hypothetical protein